MSIVTGQLDTLAQKLHAIIESESEIKSQKDLIRAEILSLMAESEIKSHRTIWGLISLKAGRKTKVYTSDKILKWEASIAAEKARLDKLGQVEIIQGDETISFTPSK